MTTKLTIEEEGKAPIAVTISSLVPMDDDALRAAFDELLQERRAA